MILSLHGLLFDHKDFSFKLMFEAENHQFRGSLVFNNMIDLYIAWEL